MKLYITKMQASGMLRGMKFELGTRVYLTPEESELVSLKTSTTAKEMRFGTDFTCTWPGQVTLISITSR